MRKIFELVPVEVAIWRVSHHHRQLVHSRIESLDLYRGQHRVISILGETNGLTHSELAEELKVSNATVSKMVQRMKHKGFVECHPDERDQRVSRVFLTDKGKDIHQQIDEMFLQLQKDETDGFSAEEIEQLLVYLERLNQNLIKQIPHHEALHKGGAKK